MNVQEWGCFSNFLRSDDVTWTMSKGGVLVKNPVSAPGVRSGPSLRGGGVQVRGNFHTLTSKKNTSEGGLNPLDLH